MGTKGVLSGSNNNLFAFEARSYILYDKNYYYLMPYLNRIIFSVKVTAIIKGPA